MSRVAILRSSSGIVVIEMIILSCLMFGTFSVLVRVTDMETMGLWALVNSLLGFSRSADFWSTGLSSFVGESRGRGETSEAVDFVSTAVLTGIVGFALLAVVGSAAIWLGAGWLAGDEHSDHVRKIVPLMALTFWLLCVGGIYQVAFLSFGRPFIKAVQTVGGAVLFLAGAIVLSPLYGLWGILLAQLIQAIAMCVFASGIFHLVVAPSSVIRWRRDKFRGLVSFGTRAMAVSILQLAVEPIIRMLASKFGGLAMVANVEVASRLIAVVRNIITALGQILVPQFARIGIGARTEISALFNDASRLFILASLIGYSLLISVAPALEEIILGRTATGFVPILLLLSAGWFANTTSAPAYFLLLARRQLRPLFWTHLIMAVGSATIGGMAGIAFGSTAAIMGVSVALVASAAYLVVATARIDPCFGSQFNLLIAEPWRLLPPVVAIFAVVILENSGALVSDFVERVIGHLVTVSLTLLACLIFGDFRAIVNLAKRIR